MKVTKATSDQMQEGKDNHFVLSRISYQIVVSVFCMSASGCFLKKHLPADESVETPPPFPKEKKTKNEKRKTVFKAGFFMRRGSFTWK